MPTLPPVTEETLESFSKHELLDIILKQFSLIETLREENHELRDRIVKLEEQVAKLSKNSSNSSKPPSSDIVKPEKSKSDGSGKPGGRKGHPGFSRKPFSEDKVDAIQQHKLTECFECHTPLTEKDQTEPWIHQVVEIPEKFFHVTEHHRFGYLCPGCQKQLYAPLPSGVMEGQLLGPNLLSLIGYMKGSLHVSYSSLQEFLKEIVQLEVSRSMLCDNLARLKDIVAAPYQELEEALKNEPSLHVDESGLKNQGAQYWVWVFCTQWLAFFSVQKSRATQVLKDILGETFKGKLISDFYSAYVKYANPFQQFCLAHLVRDIKFLTTLPDQANQQFGKKVLAQFKRLFYFWHHRSSMPPERYQWGISHILRNLRTLALEKGLPKKSQNLANRLDKHWSSYLRFLFDLEVPPTNNMAEQALRTIVIDRKITQGTRSQMGRDWCARIWTILATCRKQKRSSWQFLKQCVHASYFGTAYPSLIPARA